MTIESLALRKFADEVAERIKRKTVTALQKMTETLSGDELADAIVKRLKKETV